MAVGWLSGNPIETIILRALLTMAILWPVGYAVGLIAQGVVDRRIEKYKAEHPILSEEELQKLAADLNPASSESPHGQGDRAPIGLTGAANRPNESLVKPPSAAA